MLFQSELAELVVRGHKAQTRRLYDPRRDTWIASAIQDEYRAVERCGRLRYALGHSYSVQPGRGRFGLWFRVRADGHRDIYDLDGRKMPGEHENTRAGGGWVEARICINTIRQGHIQDISEADAKAEGIIWRVVERARGTLTGYTAPGGGKFHVTAREAFAELWDTIHWRAGERWQDNPPVWALTFDLWTPGLRA